VGPCCKGTVYLHWWSSDGLFLRLVDARSSASSRLRRFCLVVIQLPVLRSHTRTSEVMVSSCRARAAALFRPPGSPLCTVPRRSLRHSLVREGLRPQGTLSIIFHFISLKSVFHRPVGLALEAMADQLARHYDAHSRSAAPSRTHAPPRPPILIRASRVYRTLA
jgi:hypothetical protein